jgi:hypothetical protein
VDLAMGAPSLATLAETFTAYGIYQPLIKHKTTRHVRYAGDVLITYDQSKTNIDKIVNKFGELERTVKCVIHRETQNKIYF